MVSFQEGIQFEVLPRLHQTSEVGQRALAKGLSTTNFRFKAPVEKGLIEMQGFSQSKSRLRYVYLITPAGAAEKSKLTAEFLNRKVTEHETLQVEIEASIAEIGSAKADMR